MADLLARAQAALASRFRVERELGRGGMATVFLAEDLKHNRLLAVKILHPDLAAAIGPEKFLDEIDFAAHLNHPHILPLIDSGENAGLLWYAMPYVEGESLRERLTREGRLPLADVADVAAQVASALDYAHGLGILDRDIKPENLLLAPGAGAAQGHLPGPQHQLHHLDGLRRQPASVPAECRQRRAFQPAARRRRHHPPRADDRRARRRLLRVAVARGGAHHPRLSHGRARLRPDRFLQRGYSGLEWLKVGPLTIPVDEVAATLIPFRGAKFSFQYLSLADVLADRVPPEKLKGRIALVGTSAPGLLDLRATPVDNVYPGVEVHANLIAGMLDRNLKEKPPDRSLRSAPGRKRPAAPRAACPAR